jgi:hypothetical protein
MQDRRPPRRGSQSIQDGAVSPAKDKVVLGRDVQAKIGEQLRALYDDVVGQGVPDRFADLLKRLDEPDSSGGSRT